MSCCTLGDAHATAISKSDWWVQIAKSAGLCKVAKSILGVESTRNAPPSRCLSTTAYQPHLTIQFQQGCNALDAGKAGAAPFAKLTYSVLAQCKARSERSMRCPCLVWVALTQRGRIWPQLLMILSHPFPRVQREKPEMACCYQNVLCKSTWPNMTRSLDSWMA